MEKKPNASKAMNMPMPMPAVQHAAMPQPVTTLPAQTVQPVATQAPTKSVCHAHMHRYVEVQAADGYCYDGIVEHVDDQWLCLAVPGAVEPMRGFFPGPFFGPSPFFSPFSPFRPRRFNRLVLPLAGLVALSLLPYY